MKKQILILMLLMSFIIAGSFSWKSDLIFSHKYHVQDEELACSDCHDGAKTSITGKDDLLAKEAVCRDCHEEDDTECSMCHKEPDNPLPSPRITNYSLKFNHNLHIEQEEIQCLTCHSGIDESESLSADLHLPKMETCMDCHITPLDLPGCYQCHTKQEQLRPAEHTLAWNEMHGMAARSGAQICNSCHRESSCIDCHQGENIAGFSHNADFMVTHSQQFTTRESDCATCHQSRDYCIDCHVNVNYIVPVGHNSPDWSGFEHAIEGRMDFERCSVCHTGGEETCIKCHN